MVSNSSKTHFTADMSAHEVACELDVDIESGDHAIVIRESQLVSSDSIKEIVKCLYEMHLEMANFNLKCKEDIWNNQEFFLFLKDYFQNSLRALNFCTDLEDCLERTRDNYKSIVQSAVKHFEEEVEDGVNGVKYMKTLQDLGKFKDAEYLFTDEFFRPFPSFYEKHESMLDKLQSQKTKLDKKLEHEKTRARVFIFILLVLFVSLVLKGAFPPKSSPTWDKKWTAALIVVLSSAVGNLGIKWVDSILKKRQSALEGKREVISSMRNGTRTTKKDLGNIKALIDKLRIEADSMLKTADCALGEGEETVKVVIDAIQKKLEMFMNAAQNLRDNAYRCRRSSVRSRKLVLRSMFRSARD